MNRKLEIEARLERSLRNQVTAPRLSKRFDAAVWARIDAASTRTPAPAPLWASWQFILNGIGIGTTLVVLLVFGGRMLAGVEAEVTLPRFALDASTLQQMAKFSTTWITAGALALGIMMTPLGRRIRAELRELF
jgi:hypothetical protein